MNIEKIDTELIYQGRAFSISRDQVRFPDGRTSQLDIVHHSAAVTIAPITEDRAIWFIRQYRYPVAELMFELPAGVMESDETPEASAQRELREEIGLAARKLIRLGGCYLAPGYSTEFMHIFELQKSGDGW